MSKPIIVKARCFCCDHIEQPIRILKPSPIHPRGFEVECIKCGSFNSYRVSIKRDEIKIETTWIRASEKGIKKYEERTGKAYPATTQQS